MRACVCTRNVPLSRALFPTHAHGSVMNPLLFTCAGGGDVTPATVPRDYRTRAVERQPGNIKVWRANWTFGGRTSGQRHDVTTPGGAESLLGAIQRTVGESRDLATNEMLLVKGMNSNCNVLRSLWRPRPLPRHSPASSHRVLLLLLLLAAAAPAAARCVSAHRVSEAAVTTALFSGSCPLICKEFRTTAFQHTVRDSSERATPADQ